MHLRFALVILSVCLISCGGESGPTETDVASIIVAPDPVAVTQLQSVQLEVSAYDSEGDLLEGVPVSFTSSDTDLVTVDANGLIESVGPAGTGEVTVRSGSQAVEVTVAVVQVPTSLQILPNPITLGRGASLAVSALVLDAVGAPIADSDVEFAATPAALISVTTQGQVRSLGGAGTGTLAASASGLSAELPVTVFDVTSPEGVKALTVPAAGGPYGVTFGAAGAIYGIGLDGTFHGGSFGSATIRSYPISSLGLTLGLAFHPGNGRVYVAGNLGDGLMEVDPMTGGVLRRWAAPVHMYDVAIPHDGRHIYVAGGANVLYVISAETMTQVDAIGTPQSAVHLLAHPFEPIVYVSGNGRASEINLSTGEQRVFSLGIAQATALSLSGDRLLIGNEGGSIGVVTLATGAMTTVPVPDCGIYDIVAAPDAEEVLVTCSGNGTAKLLDFETLQVETTIETGGGPRRAAISTDGATAVIANESGWFDHIE